MASVHSKKILGEFLDRSDRISAVRSIRDVAIIPEVKLTHLSWKSAFKLLFCLNSVTLFRPRRVIKNQIWSTETNQQHLIPTDCTVLEFSLSCFVLAFMAALQQILLSNHFCLTNNISWMKYSATIFATSDSSASFSPWNDIHNHPLLAWVSYFLGLYCFWSSQRKTEELFLEYFAVFPALCLLHAYTHYFVK